MKQPQSIIAALGAIRAAARAAGPTRWYERRGWQFGSMEFNAAALIVFLLVSLAPLATWVFSGFAAPAWPKDSPLFAMLWVLFMAIGHPMWTWFEARAHERWLSGVETAQRPAEQARFDARTLNARLVWFGVIAVYLVVAALGIYLPPDTTSSV
jgi:hypothetical protein